MNICLIQTDPEAGKGNLDFALQAMRRRNADMYILPELFTAGFRNGTTSPSKYAEPLQGRTAQTLSATLESKPDATIVAGLLEKDGDRFCNSAAIIRRDSVDAYRQKNPVPGFGKCFAPGDFGMFFLGRKQHGYQSRFGFMICSDYFMANEFFSHYQEHKVDAIIMIADSQDTKWRRDFPSLCQKSAIPAIVCNAAGDRMGGSCAWDSAGSPVLIRELGHDCERLPEGRAIGTITLSL
jgi:predicted amidohydrolase